MNLKNLAKEIGVEYKNFEHLDISLIKKSFSNLSQEKLKMLLSMILKK